MKLELQSEANFYELSKKLYGEKTREQNNKYRAYLRLRKDRITIDKLVEYEELQDFLTEESKKELKHELKKLLNNLK